MEEDGQEAEAGEDCCDTQELKSSYALHEIKLVKIRVWMKEGNLKTPSP